MKIPKSFYQRSSIIVAKELLGKYLVINSPQDKISGKIIDVEAYPAFIDNVSHGNKRTKRTEVMYKEGGYIYVYKIYGIHHQFAVVVNKKDIPEVVFIRGCIPIEGVDIMKKNYDRPVKTILDLTKSPGNLCKSMGIDMSLYGKEIFRNEIFIEDRGDKINFKKIRKLPRVGISKNLKGYDLKYRFIIDINK